MRFVANRMPFMEQTAIKSLLDDLERRVSALRGYL